MERTEDIIRYKELEKKFTIFRWIQLIVICPISFGLSEYSENNHLLFCVIIAECIYNAVVTIAAYSKRRKFSSILKTTIYIDILYVTIMLCVRGGIRSDVFIIYILLISYNGAKFGFKGTILSLIQSLIYFSIAAFIFTPENLFSFNRYIIRVIYIAMSTYVIYQVNKIINESYDREKKANNLAMKDVLTQIPNRLLLADNFDNMKKNYNNNGQPFCIIMFDIDDFKKVNDKMGHVFGDSVLICLAKIIKKNTCENDFVCRFGGEEFVILLANSNITIANMKAEIIRKEFERNYLFDEKITISGGICAYNDNYAMIDNINFADNAMYQAKKTGKNKIVNLSDYNNSSIVI